MNTFDHIIMNPPYNGNLHLKILNEAINHSNEVVNLSPVRWLQDPLADYKNQSDFKKFNHIIKRISNIEIINASKSNKLFNITIGDLGIYYITDINNQSTICLNSINPLAKKILNKVNNKSIMDISSKEGYRGLYNGIFGIINSQHSNTSEFISNNYELFCTPRYTYTNKVIFFNSEIERLSMFKYLSSKLMTTYAKLIRINQRVPWKFVPVLPDYSYIWTDEMLYNYFNLSHEDIEFIEHS